MLNKPDISECRNESEKDLLKNSPSTWQEQLLQSCSPSRSTERSQGSRSSCALNTLQYQERVVAVAETSSTSVDEICE